MPAFRNLLNNPFTPGDSLKGEVLKKLQPFRPTFRAPAQPSEPTFPAWRNP
jgi:hypothetical protein